MIKTIIIEDEQHCTKRLLDHISNYKDVFNVVACCETVEDGLVATKTLKPELVFLDIMINDETGFDYLKQLEKINFEIIFTTAYNEYAIKAIDYSAIGYLLKPIRANDFNKAVKRLQDRLYQQSKTKEQVEILINNLKNSSNKKIFLPTTEGLDSKYINEIIYCQSEGSYTTIHIKEKEILSTKPIKFYEELLYDDGFHRVHNSFLVNLNEIIKYYKGKGGYVVMSNQDSIQVSILKKSAFLKRVKFKL